MSRSYKKTPIACRNWKGEKKFANRKVRRCKEDIANGKQYRKLYQSYDIWEGWGPVTYDEERLRFESHLRGYFQGEIHWDPREYRLKDRDYSYKHWYKQYKMK
jgi:hypothetical protein